jgi:hypothetical protein
LPDAAQLGSFHCDHVDPASRAGPTRSNNLAWACPWCNGWKLAHIKARDPQSGVVVNVFNPRRQRWNGHFAWSSDYLRIIGLTPTGRATI